MSNFCPVCKNTIKDDTVKCNVCNFTDLHREFISKEDAQGWFDTVVLPYRKQWEELEKSKRKSNLFDKELKRGNTVRFGKWYFDDSTTMKPIEWFVIALNKSMVLLLSKYCIDYLPYNNNHGSTTWEYCSLRNWLNNDFLNKAFSHDEQKSLLQTNVVNNKKNPRYSSFGGNDTIDRIFLLSENEIWNFKYDDKILLSLPTPYAKVKGGHSFCNEGTIAWYLRTPGIDNASVAYVEGSRISYYDPINYFGDSTYGLDDYRRYHGVRPAIWVKLYSDEFNATSISKKYNFNMFDYDKEGYDINGYDKNNKNSSGYYIEGFDEKGFNIEGYNKNGFDINGYRKDGFNIDGYDKNGKKRKIIYKIKSFIHRENEAEYVSSLVDGKNWGYGKKEYENGIYKGEWLENIPNGYGDYFKDGIKYEGFFINGKLSGHGKIVYDNGGKYIGAIKGNLYNGYGKYIGKNGFVYTGYWKDGVENGIGIATYGNGDKFVGEFVDGKKQGVGIYIWKDGETYEGAWENGKRNGYGTQIYINGKKKSGYWNDDVFIGK